MEIFDIVDENGIPTGDTVERKEAHREGICHRTAHIWVIRENGVTNGTKTYDILLQKRSANKDSFPGRYDTSSAGHITAGDEPITSALRELQEELGIVATQEDLTFAGTFRVRYEKEFHGQLFKDNEIAFVYVYSRPVDLSTLTLQEEEVECVEWFDLETTYHECLTHNQKFCVPINGLNTLRNYLNLK